jgi:hypothetical protein
MSFLSKSIIKFSDLGKAFGVTMTEVAEAAMNIAGGGGGSSASVGAAASGKREQQQADGSGKETKTAGLDIFALVSRLRTGAQELYP